jgi:hypothetical protein
VKSALTPRSGERLALQTAATSPGGVGAITSAAPDSSDRQNA